MSDVDLLNYPCRKSAAGACNPFDPPRQVDYDYTGGLLSSVGELAMYASAITYHPNGMLKSVTHGEGSQRVFETWTADPDGMSRPSRIAATNTAGAELWATGNYAYDGAGNIKSMGHARYWYDAFQRLVDSTTVTPLGKSTMTAYGYDSYGNRLYATSRTCNAINGRIVCGSPTYVARSVSGTTNHYGDATYDATGNVTADLRRTFSYDPLGMMMRAQVETGGEGEIRDFHYLYTADDERIAVVERINAKNKTTWSVRDFDDRVLRLWTDDNTSGTRVIAWKEDPIYRGSALLANVSPSGTKHYSLDHLGSPRLVTEVTGVVKGLQSFSDFGAGGTSDGGALQYTGHERDMATFGSGTADLPDYFHARYYDFGAGRFLSVDPVLDIKEALYEPQLWNRYAYVTNNPLKFTDDDGRYRTFYKEKAMTAENLGGAPPVIQAAMAAEVGLLSLAAGGPLRNLAFQGSLLLMRNPGAVLAAYKLLDSLGGNVSGHINPVGQTGGKLGYLLGNVESQASQGKGGFFAGVMGFTAKTLDAAIRSHFADNFKNGVLKDGRLSVTGAMKGGTGIVTTVKTVWQWNKDTKVWDLITAVPAK